MARFSFNFKIILTIISIEPIQGKNIPLSDGHNLLTKEKNKRTCFSTKVASSMLSEIENIEKYCRYILKRHITRKYV